ncbi:hypothetical protein BGZ72_005793 [Mortierella alpina]|nr:hypothetical protein BGZ72_005793 [Mortierella alpina]
MKFASCAVFILLSFALNFGSMGKSVSAAPALDPKAMQILGTNDDSTKLTSKAIPVKQGGASLEPTVSHANIMPCSSAWKPSMGHGPVCQPGQRAPNLPNPNFGLGP